MPDFRAMGMTPEKATNAMMAYNRKWMFQQLRNGHVIIDIGLDNNRATPSIFYQMEGNLMKAYKKLHPDFDNIVKP
jgi:hypothetical protein